MWKTTLLALLMWVPLQSNAGIYERFTEFFYSSEISSRHCGLNISNFIQYLSQKGENTQGITVVSITAPRHIWSFGRVVAVNSRWGSEIGNLFHQNWEFHVIAIKGGKVYDFSFNKTPYVLPLKNYLQLMFIPSESFAINGSTFRVRGEGPMYTPAHAQAELNHYRFKIMSTNSRGVFTELERDVSFDDLMEKFSDESVLGY